MPKPKLSKYVCPKDLTTRLSYISGQSRLYLYCPACKGIHHKSKAVVREPVEGE